MLAVRSRERFALHEHSHQGRCNIDQLSPSRVTNSTVEALRTFPMTCNHHCLDLIGAGLVQLDQQLQFDLLSCLTFEAEPPPAAVLHPLRMWLAVVVRS